MKTFGEGFDQELAGLPGKPGVLVKRSEGKQPGAVVLDPQYQGTTTVYGEPAVPPLIQQPWYVKPPGMK